MDLGPNKVEEKELDSFTLNITYFTKIIPEWHGIPHGMAEFRMAANKGQRKTRQDIPIWKRTLDAE